MIIDIPGFLAKRGIGGFYRITDFQDLDREIEIRGPYRRRSSANPYGEARITKSVSVEYHLRKPKNSIPPHETEQMKFIVLRKK